MERLFFLCRFFLFFFGDVEEPFWLGKLKGSDMGVDGRIIQKWIKHGVRM
jgi:hypothetical protein